MVVDSISVSYLFFSSDACWSMMKRSEPCLRVWWEDMGWEDGLRICSCVLFVFGSRVCTCGDGDGDEDAHVRVCDWGHGMCVGMCVKLLIYSNAIACLVMMKPLLNCPSTDICLNDSCPATVSEWVWRSEWVSEWEGQSEWVSEWEGQSECEWVGGSESGVARVSDCKLLGVLEWGW